MPVTASDPVVSTQLRTIDNRLGAQPSDYFSLLPADYREIPPILIRACSAELNGTAIVFPEA
jgi:hypothetical protein